MRESRPGQARSKLKELGNGRFGFVTESKVYTYIKTSGACPLPGPLSHGPVRSRSRQSPLYPFPSCEFVPKVTSGPGQPLGLSWPQEDVDAGGVHAYLIAQLELQHT